MNDDHPFEIWTSPGRNSRNCSSLAGPPRYTCMDVNIHRDICIYNIYIYMQHAYVFLNIIYIFIYIIIYI